MRFKMSGYMHNEKGASAIEFAIVLPVLLLVIFGIIEWGLYMYNRQVITNAAREGARYGVLLRQGKTDRDVNDANENPAIKSKVVKWTKENVGLVNFGSDELTDADIKINRQPNDGTDVFSTGSDLKVTVVYDYDFLFLSTIGVGPLKIEVESTMKME